MKRHFFFIIVMILLATGLVFVISQPKRHGVTKVAAILPMTGTASDYGKLMERGIKLALNEINDGNEDKEKRFDVIIEDSRSNPKDGVSALQKLLQIDKVPAVMPALSSIILACAPVTEDQKIILLNCPANSPKLRQAGKYVFNIYILSDQESEFLGEYAYNHMNARTAGIFFVNNDSGRGYRDSFSNKFISLGGSVKLSEGHEQGTTDFRTAIEKFRSSNVDLVFLASYYAESALFLKQSQELGFHTKWLSYSSIETPRFLEIGGNAAEGLIYSQPGLDLEGNDEITRKFVSAYKMLYGQEPDLWSAQYYDGTKLLWSALSSGAHSGKEIRDYFLNIKEFPGITGPISFDENNCITRKIRFKEIKKGAFTYIQE